MEFPRKFQNSKIPKFFGRCFGIQEKILEFWNFLGNSKKKLWNFGIPWEIPKKNFGILEFPRKFQNSKIPKFFGRCFGIQEKILEFWNFLGNSKKTLEFWNFLENSKKNFGILEFPRKFQKKTLEFWNFGIFEEIPKFHFFLEFPRKFQNSKVFPRIPKHLPKNFGILEFWNFRGNSKIPKFFFGIFEEIPKFQNFYLNSKTSSKKLWNFGILEFLKKSLLCVDKLSVFPVF